MKSERTREAILMAALEYFRHQPFRDLTVGELMSRVGASRATFYQYFGDLYELMTVLLDGLRDEVLSVAAPWFEYEGDPIPHLKQSLAGLVNVCYEQGPILRAVSEAAVTDDNLENTWAQFLKTFDDAVAARITQQQEMGQTAGQPAGKRLLQYRDTG